MMSEHDGKVANRDLNDVLRRKMILYNALAVDSFAVRLVSETYFHFLSINDSRHKNQEKPKKNKNKSKAEFEKVQSIQFPFHGVHQSHRCV